LLFLSPSLADSIHCLNTSEDLYYFPVECPSHTRFCLNVARIEKRISESAVHGMLIESKECDEHRICEHMIQSPLYNHKINQDEHFNRTGCVVTPHLRVCCCSSDYCNHSLPASTHSLIFVALLLLLYNTQNMGNTCGEPLKFSEIAPEGASFISVFVLTLFIAGEPFLRRYYRSTLLVVLLLESIRRGGGLFEKWYDREGRCKYELDNVMKALQTSLDVIYILENAFILFCVLRLINHSRFWHRTWVQYVIPTALAVCPLVALAQSTFSENEEPVLTSLRLHSIFIMQSLSLVGVIMLWRRLVVYRHLLLIFAVLLIIELPASAKPIYETYFEPSQTLDEIKKYYAEYANLCFTAVTIGILIRQRIIAYRSKYCLDETLLLQYHNPLLNDFARGLQDVITVCAWCMNLLLLRILIESNQKIGSYRYLIGTFAVSDLIYTSIHWLVYPIPEMYGDAFLLSGHGIFNSRLGPCLYCGVYMQAFPILSSHFIYRTLAVRRPHSLKNPATFFAAMLTATVANNLNGIFTTYVLWEPDEESVAKLSPLFSGNSSSPVIHTMETAHKHIQALYWSDETYSGARVKALVGAFITACTVGGSYVVILTCSHLIKKYL
ncbi:hypothetical protein PMAYCL1PPCAC_30306, partial [Pristionchus mayeri]